MMLRTATDYRHIELDEQGRPIIAGTRFKVHVLVNFWNDGWGVEDLHDGFPDISMAQIHSALAYYWDHKDEIDRTLQELADFEESYRRTHDESPALQRLRELKQEQVEQAQ
jgi:uncharacterized protein (DUF433 family)